jgi:hypothetical protein
MIFLASVREMFGNSVGETETIFHSGFHLPKIHHARHEHGAHDSRRHEPRLKDRDVIAWRRSAVTFLAPVRAETEQQEHSVKRTRGTRAPHILATTGRVLMLRVAHRTVAHMRPTCYQSLCVFNILSACSRFLGCTLASSCWLFCGALDGR